MSRSKKNANQRRDIRAAVASHNLVIWMGLSFGRALGRRFRALDRSNRLHWAYHDSN